MAKSNGSYVFFTPKQFDSFQYESGTIMGDKLKSSWILIKGNMKTEVDEAKRNLRYFLTQLKNAIYQELLKLDMKSNYIFDPMIKDSFYENGYCFYNIELTVFPNGPITNTEMTDKINKIGDRINEVMIRDKNFIFDKYSRKINL